MSENIERIVDDYSAHLLRIAYFYTKNRHAAEDIVQEVFMNFLQSNYSERGQLRAYLTKMTVNRSKDYLKSWNYKMVQVKSFINETAKSILPSTEKKVIDKYNNEEIKDTIYSLPKVYREVVYLYYYDSLSTEEIANVLDISVNTVKTRLRRAKQRLESMLKEAELHGR